MRGSGVSRLHFAERRACGKFGLGMPLWLMECVCERVCVDVCVWTCVDSACMHACMRVWGVALMTQTIHMNSDSGFI